MKKFILSLIFIISIISSVKSQIVWVDQSSNTYYVIPPTSGCNGLWAIDANLFPGPGCGFFTYWIDPCFANIYPDLPGGDTLFVELCTVPCELIYSCNGGFMAYAKTGTPLYTSINPNQSASNNDYQILTGLNYSKSNSIIQINCPSPSQITLLNTQGQIISSKTGTGLIQLQIQNQPAGLYFLSIISNDIKHTQKITLQ